MSERKETTHYGPSLRDLFAMNAPVDQEVIRHTSGKGPGHTGYWDSVARYSYKYADAMLEARKPKGEE